MKMKGKRLFSLFMALLLIVALIPATAFASNGKDGVTIHLRGEKPFANKETVNLTVGGITYSGTFQGEHITFEMNDALSNGLNQGGEIPFTSNSGNGYMIITPHEGNDTSTDESGTPDSGHNNYEADIVFWKNITTSIPVIKNWDGVPEGTAYPQSIEAKLLKMDGTVVQAITLTEETDWTGAFENVPVKDESGINIEYTVAEVKVEGYTSSITGNAADGYVITNTYITQDPPKDPEDPATETTSVSVTKVWAGNPEGAELPPVTIKLFANGTETASVTLNAENEWVGGWTELDAKDADGVAITYTVAEVEVEGYTSSITGNAADGYVITNTYVPQTPTQNPTIIPPYVYIPPQQETPKAELPAEVPVVEVPEVEVPLDAAPDIPEVEFEEVDAAEVPLTDVPKTGDESNMTLWMLIMAISAAGAMMSLRLNRKED